MNIYSSNKSPVYLAFRTLEILKFNKLKNIFITDDYFTFNDKNKQILKVLKDNGVRSSTFTGIKLLTNDKYAATMAQYFELSLQGPTPAGAFIYQPDSRHSRPARGKGVKRRIASTVGFRNLRIG